MTAPGSIGAGPDSLASLLQPCSASLDERGFGLHDLFPFPEEQGQADWSILPPGAVDAFSRHTKAWVHRVCLSGNAKIVLVREEGWKTEIQTFFSGERHPALVSVPPGVWHGCSPICNQPCGLLRWCTRKVAAAGEERAPWDTFGKELWEAQLK